MPTRRLLTVSLILSTSLALAVRTSAPEPKDILRSHLSTEVNPGVDIFEYANGGWLKKHPIPKTESGWGIGNEVNDELYAQLRSISEASGKRKSKVGTDDQKVGDFWTTAMDLKKADQLGIKPLEAQLKKIDAISSADDAVSVAFQLARDGVDSFIGFGVSQDEKNSDMMAVHVGQAGLGLPDRDFYFNPEAGVAKIRDEYVKHLKKVLSMSGVTDDEAATNVMAFETELAKISRKLEDLRDPEKNYNKMPIQDVQSKLTPSIDWAAHIAKWRIQPKTAIVGQPEFLSGMEALVAKTPPATLQQYLRYHLVSQYASYLSKEMDREDFHFNHQVLSGQKEPRPRWKRVIGSENQAVGFILGRIFVKNYFPPSAKTRYVKLVEAFRTTYGKRIDKLDWMSAATKKKAHVKLASLTKKVGFPDKWRDYSKLVIGRRSYCENMMNAARWNFDDSISKFGKPVDRTEWGMTPQTYNAYYNPSNNEIVLPAAVFAIPGLKDSQLDDALMYGYAGASTIGHEMTHGFDDEGRQFDAKGNLKDWWTKEDAKRFDLRANVMVQEFNSFEPIKGIHINGKASLGENIADYGGVLLGLDAFKQTKQYKEGKKIGGLTPVQRFFLGYALSWMSQERTESLRRQLLSDVHAPAKWRVIGPLTNIPEFYAAFNIKPNQPMWRAPKNRVRIW